MGRQSRDTDELVDRVRHGSRPAFEELFARHREQLKQALEVRMDFRLGGRVDISDIVQETYLEASQRFDDYLADPRLRFYVWLRWIGREKVIQHYRHHVAARRRAVDRELVLPVDRSNEIVQRVAAGGATPTGELAARERAELLERALSDLADSDREVILLRHFEGLSHVEAAAVLGLAPDAARKRHVKALRRLGRRLKELGATSGADPGGHGHER